MDWLLALAMALNLAAIVMFTICGVFKLIHRRQTGPDILVPPGDACRLTFRQPDLPEKGCHNCRVPDQEDYGLYCPYLGHVVQPAGYCDVWERPRKRPDLGGTITLPAATSMDIVVEGSE